MINNDRGSTHGHSGASEDVWDPEFPWKSIQIHQDSLCASIQATGRIFRKYGFARSFAHFIFRVRTVLRCSKFDLYHQKRSFRCSYRGILITCSENSPTVAGFWIEIIKIPKCNEIQWNSIKIRDFHHFIFRVRTVPRCSKFDLYHQKRSFRCSYRGILIMCSE